MFCLPTFQNIAKHKCLKELQRLQVHRPLTIRSMTLGENLTYVGVIRFIFQALLFYQLDLHNGTCLVLASLR
jgi:hypothetical protein